MTKKIVLTGAPGTGKSTLIDLLHSEGYYCMHEISREIIKEAQSQGIQNIFLTDPIVFSEKILEQRIKQYKQTITSNKRFCFFDRGIPDITAYLDDSQIHATDIFKNAIHEHPYDLVFVFPPWKKIYTQDRQRFETFKQAKQVHKAIVEAYKKTNSSIIIIPKDTPHNRLAFILDHCNASINTKTSAQKILGA